MRLCYLSSDVTVSSSPNRRDDAFEHDWMMDALRAAFDSEGGSVEEISWRNRDADWGRYDAVMIGTAWDYQDHLEDFLAVLETVTSKTRLYNSSDIVKWNTQKTYLRDLSEKGARVIPTLWFDKVSDANLLSAFDDLQSDDLVLKRQVGASAEGQFRVRKGEAIPQTSEPMMAQPFLKTIQTEGEISFIYIGGEFSHAVLKTPQKGEYRIQSVYGGAEEAYAPSADDLAAAQSVVNAVAAPLLYARVDMLRGEDGALRVMELELVEPFLYPQQGPELGPRIYKALKRMLSD